MVLVCCTCCGGCCGKATDCCEVAGLCGGIRTLGFCFCGKRGCLSLYDFDKRSLKAFNAICLQYKTIYSKVYFKK